MDRSSTTTFKPTILILTVLVSSVYLLRTTSNNSFQPRSLDDVQDYLDTCSTVDISDSFTESEIDRATSISNYLSKVRGGNELITLAEDNPNQSTEDFGKTYLIHLIPFAAIGITMFVLSVLCLICHCCNYTCFQRCSAPTAGNKLCYVILSVVFTILMIGTAAAGWYFTKGLDSGYQRSSCAISNMIAEFSTGSPEQSWIGLSLVISNLTDIQGSINSTIQQLPNIDEVHTSLTTNYNALLTSINGYYNDNQGQNVTDPAYNTSTITPDFIAKLGPPSDNDTISGTLRVEADTKYDTIDSGLNSSASSINHLKSQSQTITNTLQDGINEVSGLNNTLTELLQDYSSGAQEGKSINNDLSIGIYVFFISAAVVSGILLLGVLNSFTLKSQIGYRILIIARYVVNVVLIFCSIVTAVLFPVLIVAMEGCNAAQTAFKNETLFSTYGRMATSDYDSSNFSTYVHTCFFSDGYILGDLGVNDQLQDLNNIYNQVQNLSSYYNLSIPDSYVIPIQEAYIELFKTGQVPVSTTVGYELYLLNNYTDNNPQSPLAATCTSQDTWALNSINCTSPSDNGTLFEPSEGPSFNYGQPTCIGFDQFADFNAYQRYMQDNACVNNQLIIPFIGGFQNHIISVSDLFTRVGTSLNTVNNSNAQFMSQARQAVAPLGTISGNVLEILNMVGNNQTGLISNFNCAFMKTNSQDAIDNLCIAYLPILFVTSVCILAFALAALLGLFPLFFAGKIQEEERKRIYEEDLKNFDQQFLLAAE